MNSHDICPKCKKKTWHFDVYLHFTAPGRFYGHLGKTARRDKEVKCEAALWETVSWFCTNPRCMYLIRPVRQVRLEEQS